MTSIKPVLESPDGTEQFTLYVNERLETQVEVDVVLDTLSANVENLTGRNLNVTARRRTISGEVSHGTVGVNDFPNSSQYNSDELADGYVRELEKAASEYTAVIDSGGVSGASLIWIRAGVSDKLNGIVTEVNHSILPTENSQDVYEYTIEFTEIDIINN